ncbi:hypothetical protein GCM10011402_38430 [Paracoccus acridae]|uniref:Uncharacterized protein n=1 Tax=Paracoccus acridae TaxID=1795310 RepID=A0ABQ1VPC1_9RHOB|nr:hypothetical protein [Paracoccus acridae]GGF82154.1 hypothetical protein GCM10011402_38430 [Paracoccus acridae]
MIGVSIISRRTEQAVLALTRKARLAREHLHAATLQDCPASIMDLAARVDRQMADGAKGPDGLEAVSDDIRQVIHGLSRIAQDDVKPVIIDDESCMTALHERLVPTYRAILCSVAATALVEYLEALAAVTDARRADALLKNL